MRTAVTLAAMSVCAAAAIGASLSDGYARHRAVMFVTSIAISDFREAQHGAAHVFNYAQNETEQTLSSSIEKWLDDGDKTEMRLLYADQETIFAVYWAATQMSWTSECFDNIHSKGCMHDLGYWLFRVRTRDPRFIAAYERSYRRLGLPPLVRQTD